MNTAVIFLLYSMGFGIISCGFYIIISAFKD